MATFNNKVGTGKSSASDSMSKWDLPSPQSIPVESAPAKPQGGTRGGGLASKTANTHSGTHGMVDNIKSRF